MLFVSAGEKLCIYVGNICTLSKEMLGVSGCAMLAVALPENVPCMSALGPATLNGGKSPHPPLCLCLSLDP